MQTIQPQKTAVKRAFTFDFFTARTPFTSARTTIGRVLNHSSPPETNELSLLAYYVTFLTILAIVSYIVAYERKDCKDCKNCVKIVTKLEEGLMQGQHAEWVTMAVAAEMFKVSPAKISRMAANGEIRTRENRRDKRVKLVNVDELRRYFEENPYTGE